MRRSDDDFDDDEDEDDDAPAHTWRRWLLYLSLAGFGLFLGVLIPYVWVLDGKVRETFGKLQWQVPTTVYAQPLRLATGQRMDAPTLLLELSASLYRNDVTNDNRSLRMRLIGTKSNRDAIGAVVRLFTPDGQQTRMVKTGSSYLSQSELCVTFGLGKRTAADRIVVEWPSGRTDEFRSLKYGQYQLTEGQRPVPLAS